MSTLSDLRAAVAATLEPSALVAEDDYAAAVAESRAALEALRLLEALHADAFGGPAVEQLYRDLCDAIRARDERVLRRVCGAAREEMAARRVVPLEEDVMSAGLLLGRTGGSGDAGSAAARLSSIVFGRRHQKTTLERAMLYSVVVWTLALLLLAGAWVWFTILFVQRRRNPAVLIDVVPEDRIELPALTVCPQIDEKFPMWATYPTDGFMGSPWFALRFVQEGQNAQLVQYPNTRGFAEDFIFTTSNKAECKTDTDKLNPNVHISRSKRSNTSDASSQITCKRCLTIGRMSPITVGKATDEVTEPPDALRLEFVASRVPYYCFYPESRGVNLMILEAINSEIYNNLDELIERGVLDLNGANRDETTATEADGNRRKIFVFPTPSFDPSSAPPPERAPDYAPDYDGPDSFACGVYLFSGLWYPTTVERVQWIYDKNGTGWWERNNDPGFGPYFNTTSSFDTAGFSAGLPSRNPRSDPTVYTGIPDFDLYLTDADDPLSTNLSSSRRIVALASGTTHFLRLEKEIGLDASVLYKPIVATTTRFVSIEATEQDSRTGFFRLQLDISYSRFVVQKIITRPDYEVAAYLADVSNFFGIFTGTSIFSLLVAALSFPVMRQHYQSGEDPEIM